MKFLADQQAALDTAASLARTHGHLPAAHIATSTVFRDQVDIHLHDGFDAFEAWREALGIAPATVDHHMFEDGRMYLQATTSFLGVTLQLNGYATRVQEQEGASCVPST